jgi:hypothetical protein
MSKSTVLRRTGLTLGGLAFVLICFFGTLFVLNRYDAAQRDEQRAAHARLLKTALEKYHATRNAYPLFDNNQVDDLKAALVGGGYLSAIPADPLRSAGGAQYRYASNGSNVYGLLITLERSGPCITGVGTAGTGMWQQPPDCPF